MKKMILILTGLAMFVCTRSQNNLEKKYRLDFELKAVPENTKAYLLYQTNGKKIFDSSAVKNGKVSFSGSVERLVPATIVLDHQAKGLQRLLQEGPSGMDYVKIYLCEGQSSAKAKNKIAELKFFFGTVNHDFSLLQQNTRSLLEKWGAVGNKLIKETDADSLNLLRKMHDSLAFARIPVLENFIRRHPRSLISLIAWQEWKSLKQAQKSTPIDELKTIFETLSSNVRSSDEASQARLFFTNNMKLKPGEPAPDFVQPDVNGKNVRLSDYRGEYVLVDFWASWCGSCRVNHPALVKLYEDFSSKNFTILGISLDEKDGKQKWIDAIKKDGLTWQQVSDLKHWDNDVVKLYSVPAVPFSVLIDPDGKIIKLGGSPEEVRTILQTVLNSAR